MKHALLIGGAGFIGSNLATRLLNDGWQVTVLDNLITGREENLAAIRDNEQFSFIKADIIETSDVEGDFDVVFYLAALASPKFYCKYPIESLRVGAEGTRNGLEIAKKNNAVFFSTSTSEVYGSPLEHPQKETYWGNVNPIGPRSVYDEAKRYAESLVVTYGDVHNIDYRIIRIFNTYGPNMDPEDGRAIPNFILAALNNENLPIYGDGTITRSACYIDDLIDGIMKMLESDEHGPLNLGNDEELTIKEWAEKIIELTGSSSQIEFQDAMKDDPPRRRPDLTLTTEKLKWKPTTSFEQGLLKTIEYFKSLST